MKVDNIQLASKMLNDDRMMHQYMLHFIANTWHEDDKTYIYPRVYCLVIIRLKHLSQDEWSCSAKVSKPISLARYSRYQFHPQYHWQSWHVLQLSNLKSHPELYGPGKVNGFAILVCSYSSHCADDQYIPPLKNRKRGHLYGTSVLNCDLSIVVAVRSLSWRLFQRKLYDPTSMLLVNLRSTTVIPGFSASIGSTKVRIQDLEELGNLTPGNIHSIACAYNWNVFSKIFPSNWLILWAGKPES